MSGLIWLTVAQVAGLYADGKRGRVENWIRRDNVVWKKEHGLRWVDAESVETYLKTRPADPETGESAFRRQDPSANRRGTNSFRRTA